MNIYLGLLAIPIAWAGAARLLRSQGWGAAIAGSLLLVFIGLRYRVGGDWDPYLDLMRRIAASDISDVLAHHDFGYWLLNYVVAHVGGNIAVVNLVCGSIFVTGLIVFCATRPMPEWALLLAIPVLVMAAMNFVRQSVAIGFLMIALALDSGRRDRSASVAIVAALLFHWTALALLPLTFRRVFPAKAGVWLWLAGGILLALIALAINATVPPAAKAIASEGIAFGASFRGALTLLALAVLIIGGPRILWTDEEQRVVKFFAAFAVTILLVLPVMPTVADRLGFYLVPFQMMVLTRVAALPRTAHARMYVRTLFAAPYVLIFVGWLTLSDYTTCMWPYESYLQGHSMRFSALPEQYRPSHPLSCRRNSAPGANLATKQR